MIYAWLFLLPFRLFKPGHFLVLAREETLLTDIFHMLIVLEMKYFFLSEQSAISYYGRPSVLEICIKTKFFCFKLHS